MNKVFFLFGFVFFNVFSIRAQNALEVPDVLPPSPEAAAFAKNVNIPVSYSSGTPGINFPFYTVKSGSLNVPVSISYNASGIRVEETPSWVGLGWSLSAGGQISRTIRGIADEELFYGYMNVPNNRKVKYVDTAHCRCQDNTGESWAIEMDIQQYHLDLEPDQYTFSVPGYSGDFYYNQDSAKFILVPYQNIKVEGGPGNFVLTLPNGVKAFFGGYVASEEVVEFGTTSSYIEGLAHDAQPINTANRATTWMLNRLADPVGKIIEFTYGIERILTFGRGGERFGPSVVDGSNGMRRQSFYKQYIRKPVLEMISGDNVDVYFKRSVQARQDMPNYDGGSRSLDTIVVKTKNNLEVRSFYFHYDYFVSPVYSAAGLLGIEDYAEVARKRLYLKSITEKKGPIALPPYEFAYSDIELPSRLSTSQDYWGYTNGKSNGMHLMPRIPALLFYPWIPQHNELNKVLPPYGTYFNNEGSDRRIDTNYTQARILKKITYPTGGSVDYTYEQNKASTKYLNIYGGMMPPDMVEKTFTLSLLSVPMPTEPPYSLSYAGTFIINVPATQVKITPQLPTCSTYADASCKLTVNLRALPDNNLITSINTTNTLNMQLASGMYGVEVLVNGSPDDYPPSFNVMIQWGERLDSLNFPVGGVRVKKVVIRDGVGNTVSRSYDYTYEGSAENSGILESCPTYKVYDINPEGDLLRQYFVSNSILPLTIDGKTLRYDYVKEYYDSTQSSFKTTYSFTSGIQVPPSFAAAKTGAPYLTWNWQKNLLQKKQVFEKTAAGLYRMLSEEENFYYPHKPVIDLYGLYGPQIIPYDIVTEWYLPDSSTSVIYSYTSGMQSALKTAVKHYYNDHFLPSKLQTSNSKGTKIDTKILYPTDYNEVTGFNTLTLYSKHIWDAPIKQESSIAGKIRSGNIIKYNENGQPLERYGYESAVLQDTILHNPNLVLGSNYQLKMKLAYDGMGNIKQVDEHKNGPVAYIWDYQINGFTEEQMNQYPIAVVHNAEINNIAYTSFENVAKGNWDFAGSATSEATAVTGNKVYSLNEGSISKSGLPSSGTYVVSYWSQSAQTVSNSSSVITGKSINGWTYYEHKVVNPSGGTITLSGSGTIDELRLYPQNAQMISYTYDPLFGVTSQCDVNNRITYYEYDGLNRLIHLRDEQKNILKKYCYNYQGQTEECQVYGNVAKSGIFTRTNCPSGNWGGQVTYSVPANLYYATSQAGADAMALQDVDQNGPAYANQTGSCNPYYYNIAKSGTYTKNNCGAGSTGSQVAYPVAAGAYTSTISQADADAKAQADVNQNGQTYANIHGSCAWYSVQKSGTFTKNNCAPGGYGSSVTYTVQAGAYSSTISQVDADTKAQNDINTNGQNYANTHGYCTWYSAAASGTFTRNNCGTGYQGSTVTYSVSQGAYTSNISQVDADQKATNDVNQNGQSYANQNGTCTILCTSCAAPRKCINGICERGFKVYTSSTYDPNTGMYECISHMEYSDGSQGPSMIEYSAYPCPVN
jgi:hypothetical protein